MKSYLKDDILNEAKNQNLSVIKTNRFLKFIENWSDILGDASSSLMFKHESLPQWIRWFKMELEYVYARNYTLAALAQTDGEKALSIYVTQLSETDEFDEFDDLDDITRTLEAELDYAISKYKAH
ncbi:MAG: hypothetical protein M0R51_10545 [Clostridia bacterium]|jgi:hypothetical protein|nr:hypothetical protein [Clostridia bacterium]